MESPASNRFLVVGLGNPKPSYLGTRHNIGRDFITHLASKLKQRFTKSRHADHFEQMDFLFFRLSSYMNASGEPVKNLLESAAPSASAKNLVVVVDDFMIPFGSLRLRPRGSSGGHKGLESIIAALGTEEFGRLRAGVGPVPPDQDPADFVLKRFTKEEEKKVPRLFDLIHQGLQILNEKGYDRAMGEINKQHF